MSILGDACIGIVFHVFGYRREGGGWFSDYDNIIQSAYRLVDQVNLQFSRFTSGKLQFYVSEIRTPEDSRYRYLGLRSVDEWRNISRLTSCGTEDRIKRLARRWNAPTGRFVNIYVGGLAEYGQICTVVPSPKGPSTWKWKYIHLAYGFYSKLTWNNPLSFEWGSKTLTSGIAGYFGIYPTWAGVEITDPCGPYDCACRAGNCTCSASELDYVRDTPAEPISLLLPVEALSDYCIKPEITKAPSPPYDPVLHDLCGNQPGFVNLFNFMDASDVVCTKLFTQGQIQRLERLLTRRYDTLLTKSRKLSLCRSFVPALKYKCRSPGACLDGEVGSCTNCTSGCFPLRGKCQRCDSSCISCSERVGCVQCQDGFYLSNPNVCSSCEPGCDQCSDGDGNCTRFSPLYAQ